MAFKDIRMFIWPSQGLHFRSFRALRTIRVYRNGEHADYTGPRKADGIIAYMTK